MNDRELSMSIYLHSLNLCCTSQAEAGEALIHTFKHPMLGMFYRYRRWCKVPTLEESSVIPCPYQVLNEIHKAAPPLCLLLTEDIQLQPL